MNKLEKLRGICVRGSEERGHEIIEAFVDAGATSGFKYDGSSLDIYYFVNKRSVIVSSFGLSTNLTEITLSELKEIVYAVDWDCPPKYVKSTITGNVFEYIKNHDLENFIGKYVVAKEFHKTGEICEIWKNFFRLLTSSELSALEKELEVPKVIAGVDFGKSLDMLDSIAYIGNSLDKTWGNTTHENRMKGIEKEANYLKENAPELFKTPIDRTIYQRLALLGFKKNKIQDDVYKELYGYHPFQMRKQLDTVTFFVWDKTEPDNELIHFVINDAIMGSSTVDAVELTLEKLDKQS